MSASIPTTAATCPPPPPPPTTSKTNANTNSTTSLPNSSTPLAPTSPPPAPSAASSSSSLLLADASFDNDSSNNAMASNRSTLREFLASIATMRGDLSTITAPPFVLSTLSTVELPQFWACRPDVFVGAAFVGSRSHSGTANDPPGRPGAQNHHPNPKPNPDPDPDLDPRDEEEQAAKRMLLVLRWWVSSLRGQQYAGREPSAGVKKPLNAVLGEVFVASWGSPSPSSSVSTALGNAGRGNGGAGAGGGEEATAAAAANGNTILGQEAAGKDIGTTFLVAEQTSHHPPVTACRVWNDAAGVQAEGFTRQEITLSGSGVLVRQLGYALFRIREKGETYLIPLPDVKIKGILSGTPYPELSGRYVIAGTGGWGARVEFSGKGGFLGLGGSGERHGVRAEVFTEVEGNGGVGGFGEDEGVRYKLEGHWDREFTITDARTGEVLETFDVAAAPLRKAQTVKLEEMDPYETGRVWRGVRDALARGDMGGVSSEKSRVEDGQREMRKVEQREGILWESVFFKDVERDEVGEELVRRAGQKWERGQTMGVWKFDGKAWEERRRPFHGRLRPDNTLEGDAQQDAIRGNDGPQYRTVTTSNGDLAARKDKPPPAGVSIEEHSASEQAAVRASVDSAAPSEKVHPPLRPEQQQKEAQETKLADGVGGMSLEEQTAVEEMLRNQYTSARGSKRDKKKE